MIFIYITFLFFQHFCFCWTFSCFAFCLICLSLSRIATVAEIRATRLGRTSLSSVCSFVCLLIFNSAHFCVSQKYIFCCRKLWQMLAVFALRGLKVLKRESFYFGQPSSSLFLFRQQSQAPLACHIAYTYRCTIIY